MPTVSLIGDVMLRTPLTHHPSDVRSAMQETLAELRQSSLVIANLEMPLSRRGDPLPKFSNLRSDPEIIEDIVSMGVDAVSLANNHAMDFGPLALSDTLATCDRASIVRCGAGANRAEAAAPVILHADGYRIGLLAFACTAPLESEAGPSKPGISVVPVKFSFEVDLTLHSEQPGTMPTVHTWTVQEGQDRVCRQVRELKQRVDLVMVAAHWGVPSFWNSPYLSLLAEYQQPLGHALIEAGADVIIGHHAHALHPIEWYRGKPIFYSLGNFLFEGSGSYPHMAPESMIVRMGLDNPTQIELVPLMLNAAGIPVRARDDTAAGVFTLLTQLSESYGARVFVDSDHDTARVAGIEVSAQHGQSPDGE